MGSSSTDATYVVDLAVGASTRLSGVPESARNTPTGTATRTLRSDLPQSPVSPSSNGDPSTLHRVRPDLTINPHALPIGHRPRAGRLSDWADALERREPPEAPVSSPDGRPRGGSTSPKVSKSRKPSATRPHWTDAFVLEPPLFASVPEFPMSLEYDHVLVELCSSAFESHTFVSAPEPISYSPWIDPDTVRPETPPVVSDRFATSRGVLVDSCMSQSLTRVPTVWRLSDVRCNFPTDLTGCVVREGQEPFSCGGFGDIYRGTLRISGRSIDVAVKAIRTYSADDGDDTKREKVSLVGFLPLSVLVQQAVQRIRREIKTWLNLDHNNVVPLFGTTMNFGRFPAMVSDVAAGLRYLHSRSVVHGDLSGSNVLIDGNGRACISDFGLSTLLTQLGGSTFAPTREPLGTLRWTAPELFELSEPGDEDEPPHIITSPRSDVYSFGRIMLQILTGKVPFHYWTREVQVMHAISRGVIPQRPRQELVTDRQWSFMQRCWMPLDAVELRPCVDEIVEFVRQELVHIEKA
ncbi:kinase-like protein [Paxillus ammoniavirescens]|nr:kinase-like protein [Paxillus ammoniavirescens]